MKQIRINLRAQKELVKKIDKAATQTYETRTDFILRAAIERAYRIILSHL